MDGTGKECEWQAGPASEPDLVHLHRLGEARADEHLALGGMPAQKGRPAELRVPAHRLDERGRHSRDAFDDQVVAGGNVYFSGMDWGEEKEEEKNNAGNASHHRRGIHRDTDLQYDSYGAPNNRLKVGSS